MKKKIALRVLGGIVVIFAAWFAAPTNAAPDWRNDSRAPKLFAPTLIPTRAPNDTEMIVATRPGRCEVPILWWYLAELKTERKCSQRKRERGTLEMTPYLPRNGLMSLLVEWRILANGKLKFKCTGPISFVHVNDNMTPHTYSIKTKPGENLVSVNIYTYPYGWLGLERNATSTCIAR